jgi:hypothetical protein
MSPEQVWSAEAFYADLLGRVHAFESLSRNYADAGDDVAAVISQWGADVANLQAAAWERIVVVSRSPQGPLFDIGSKAIAGMHTLTDALGQPYLSAKSLVEAARDAMVGAIGEDLGAEVRGRFGTIEHLDRVPAPRGQQLTEAAERRLGGLAPQAFVVARRAAAHTRMEQAVATSAGRSEAIAAAYEADMLTLEAYLVESAVLVGDECLLTVQLRWDFATTAVTRLASVPDDVIAATSLVRHTLVRSLGSGDGRRLERTWLPLPQQG